ncbi:glucokinase [Marinivivus vitaminiproducens]|uniref:glucokinase n=1 Tax=Marinivivus vitaminiproducens TaxID=3035935 RepID=UPI002797F7BD|nr:glucokinase [Geminicoccaceae bacterium SCSIO 64248]
MRRLIADIGGTHARFALSDGEGDVGESEVLAVADYDGPVAAARSYLKGRTADEAVFAVALPVAADRVKLTNADWDFSIRAVQSDLGLTRLAVINDFVAQALAVPQVAPSELRSVLPGAVDPLGPKAVLGPGTGLGVAGLLPARGGGWRPVASEGGHVSFAPGDDEEIEILRLLRQRHGHVSSERLVSGPGLVAIARACATLRNDPFDVTDPAEITRRARAGTCPVSVAAVRRFVAVLGAVAGDVALMFCATGGLYIGGGIVPKLGDLLDPETFRARFVGKGRLGAMLRNIPVQVVLRSEPGLLGTASYRFET